MLTGLFQLQRGGADIVLLAANITHRVWQSVELPAGPVAEADALRRKRHLAGLEQRLRECDSAIQRLVASSHGAHATRPDCRSHTCGDGAAVRRQRVADDYDLTSH